jgi:hypothetical protein
MHDKAGKWATASCCHASDAPLFHACGTSRRRIVPRRLSIPRERRMPLIRIKDMPPDPALNMASRRALATAA